MNWYKRSQFTQKKNQWSWEMFLKGISLGIFGSIALEFLAVSQWDKLKSVYEKNKNIFMQNPASAVEIAKQDFENLDITQQESGENISINPRIINPNPKHKPDIRRETVDQTIARHEGKQYTVYKDTKKIPTIGIGFNLLRDDARTKIEALGLKYDAVLKGQQSLTNDQINTLYKQDLAKARHDAREFISNFDKQPASIQNVLVNMAFNMGAETLAEFKNFKIDIENKNYQSAAQRMERSKWYKQVGDRSRELTKLVRDTVKSFLTGNWYKQSNQDKIKEFEDHWKEILGLGEYAPDAPQPKKKKKSRDFQHSMDINENEDDDGF